MVGAVKGCAEVVNWNGEKVCIVSYDGAPGCGKGWGRGAKGCVLRW